MSSSHSIYFKSLLEYQHTEAQFTKFYQIDAMDKFD